MSILVSGDNERPQVSTPFFRSVSTPYCRWHRSRLKPIDRIATSSILTGVERFSRSKGSDQRILLGETICHVNTCGGFSTSREHRE